MVSDSGKSKWNCLVWFIRVHKHAVWLLQQPVYHVVYHVLLLAPIRWGEPQRSVLITRRHIYVLTYTVCYLLQIYTNKNEGFFVYCHVCVLKSTSVLIKIWWVLRREKGPDQKGSLFSFHVLKKCKVKQVHYSKSYIFSI